MKTLTMLGAGLGALFMLVGLSAADAAPVNFLYTSNGELAAHEDILRRPDIEGAQVIYNWKALESLPGEYDFSAIERDLALTDALGKKLFVQIQDRFFSPAARNVPEYLLTGAQYGGGLVPQIEEGKTEGYGWVAMQWNQAVRERYQALLAALAERFDGEIYGINLPETAIDVRSGSDAPDFTCDAYFAAEMENLGFARTAFTQSHVVQYVNFWPCEWDNDHDYMGRFFAYADENRIGLGGPDIAPYRRGQMKNSYPFFNRYKGQLSLVAMAIQEPTLAYLSEETGEPYTREEFLTFATDYLGVDVIFWSAETPWLHE
jgi:hypothetical protein